MNPLVKIDIFKLFYFKLSSSFDLSNPNIHTLIIYPSGMKILKLKVLIRSIYYTTGITFLLSLIIDIDI